MKAENRVKCPECGAKMILRNGKFGEFYGCTKFPGCKGSRNLPGRMSAAEANSYVGIFPSTPNEDDEWDANDDPANDWIGPMDFGDS